MQLTWLDNNSWIINVGKQNILLDPWLVDSLVFANLPWLFEGKRPQPLAIPESIDSYPAVSRFRRSCPSPNFETIRPQYSCSCFP